MQTIKVNLQSRESKMELLRALAEPVLERINLKISFIPEPPLDAATFMDPVLRWAETQVDILCLDKLELAVDKLVEDMAAHQITRFVRFSQDRKFGVSINVEKYNIAIRLEIATNLGSGKTILYIDYMGRR